MIDTTGEAGDHTDGGGALAEIGKTCVHLRFPDEQLHQAADYLATSARRPSAVTIELDPHTVHRSLPAGCALPGCESCSQGSPPPGC